MHATDLHFEWLTGWHAVCLRGLPGAQDAIADAVAPHGLPNLPAHGFTTGSDPLLVAVRPGEHLLLTTQRSVADAVLHALAPGRHALACAVEVSQGLALLQLTGPQLPALLHHLLDAQVLPPAEGRCTRTRLAAVGGTGGSGGVALTVVRRADGLLLAVDRDLAGSVDSALHEVLAGL
jgi:hypothetical protein